MKRWISLFLALCLCITFYPVTRAEAYDPKEITSVYVNDLAYPITGREADFEVTVDAHSNYHVDTTINGDGWINGIKWCHYASVDSMTPGDTYGYGTYLVFICIAPNEGYYYGAEEDFFAWHMYGIEGECRLGTVEPVKDKMVMIYSFDATDKKFTVEVGYEGLFQWGTVSGSGTYYYGETATLVARPNMGYALGWWEIDGSEEKLYDNPCSYTVMKDETIRAIFVRAPFEDICGTDYYYKPVVWAVEQGITTGATETLFAPDKECTRAQAVTFLWRAKGCPEPVRSPGFADVPYGSYYYKAVAWAVEQGITTGTSNNYFSPDKPCTRAQIVTFLWRLANKYDYGNTTIPFTDVPADAYYYDAVRFAVADGVTTGTTATTFSPDNICTRGQIVTFLWRCLAKG